MSIQNGVIATMQHTTWNCMELKMHDRDFSAEKILVFVIICK